MRCRLSYQLPFIASAIIVILFSSIFNIARADSNTDTAATREKSNASAACGQTIDSIMPLKKEFNTASDWHAVAYLGESELAHKCKDTPSRLCFRKGKEGQDQDCFLAQICCLKSTGEPYECWTINELKVIPFFKGSHPDKVLLFSTQFNAAGSDWLDLITLWSYDRKTDRFIEITPRDKLKAIAFNAQGGYRLFDMNIKGTKKILVVGNFIWGEDEVHYSNHFFNIYIYVYQPKKNQFIKLGKYKTKRKYSGEDIEERPDRLFDAEMKNIKRYIRNKLR